VGAPGFLRSQAQRTKSYYSVINLKVFVKGSVSIYERNSDGTLTKKEVLQADDATFDRFGHEVAYDSSSGCIIVSSGGLCWCNEATIPRLVKPTKASLFEKDGAGGWLQTANLVTSAFVDNDDTNNGAAKVPIEGDLAVVGAWVDDVVCLLTATSVLMLVDNGLPNPDRGTACLT